MVPLRAVPAPNKAELAWPPRFTPTLRSAIRVKATICTRIAPATDDVELARIGRFAIGLSHNVLMNTTVNTGIAPATDEVELARRGRFAITRRYDVLMNAVVNTRKAPATDEVELAHMTQFANPLSNVIPESTTVHTRAAPPTGSLELMCALKHSSPTDTGEGRKRTGATVTDELALATGWITLATDNVVLAPMCVHRLPTNANMKLPSATPPGRNWDAALQSSRNTEIHAANGNMDSIYTPIKEYFTRRRTTSESETRPQA